MTTVENPSQVDLPALLESLRSKAIEDGPNPEPLMKGTFAIYATPDGGLMMVASVPDGPMAGTHHQHMPPAVIRGLVAFFGGGGVAGAFKSVFRRRKAVDDGQG